MASQDVYIPPKEIAPGVFTTGGTGSVPTNSAAAQTISATQLQPEKPIDVTGTITTPTDTGSNLVASGDATQSNLQRYLDLANQPTTSSGGYDELLKQLGLASDSLTGRGAAQTQAEQTTGFTQANKELADLNAQYLAKKAEYDKLNANIEAGAGRKGLTTSQMTGQQGAVNRAAAADLGLLQAQILGKQGQVEAAQNAVNRAVDLMYQDREAVYNSKLNQLNLIKDRLTGEEAKRAKALEYALSIEKTQSDDAKQLKKDIQTTAFTLAKNKAPQSLINRAYQAKTMKELMTIPGMSNFLMSPVEKMELELKSLALQKARKEFSTDISAKDIPLAVAQTEDKVNRIKNLKQDSYALRASTGAVRAIAPGVSSVNDWRANVKNLLADLELDELGRVKVSGVTFGQLSNGEREAVGRAATAIKAAQVGEKGRFRMSEKEFIKNLNTIQKMTELDFERRVGLPYTAFESQLNQVTPEEYAEKVIEGGNPYSTLE